MYDIHANKVSDDIDDPSFAENPDVFPIEGRKGLYRESTSMLYYYEHRGTSNNVDKLFYAQFCKEYEQHDLGQHVRWGSKFPWWF